MSKLHSKRIILRIREGAAIENVLPANIRGMGSQPYKISVLYPYFSESGETILIPQNISSRKISPRSKELQSAYKGMSYEEKCLARIYVLEAPDGADLDTFIDRLNQSDGVEYAQFDRLNALYTNQGDPLIDQLWSMKKVELQKVWKLNQGKDITVAVLDTGVDYNHPDIKENMWTDAKGKFGFDFSDNDDDPQDFHGHGTHVAGTIAAVGNNQIGVIGVAPKAKIMAIKIFPNAFDSIIAKALKWAVDNGAKVLNNSWGPDDRRPSNPVIEDAINYVNSKGAICVCAAGNRNDDIQHYSPGNMPTVITVGSTDNEDKRSGFSNWGSGVNVSAPGSNILSLEFKTSNYSIKSGTSMASSHVAGLAALYIAQNPKANFDNVISALEDSADVVGTDKPLGIGRINAAKALQSSGLNPDISAVAWGSNRLDIFWKGESEDLQHNWWAPGWNEPVSLGGVITSPPNTVSWGPNRINVFARGTDDAIWHREWDGLQWGGWESIGGIISSEPSAVSWGPNRIDLFVRGKEKELLHRIWEGQKWLEWQSLGGNISSKPVAVSWEHNRLDVFAKGIDNALWHQAWNGSQWKGWQSLGGTISSPPEVVSWGPNRIDIFAKGTDNALWHRWWNGRGWGGWESLGGIITSDPSACSWGPNRLDVFARGSNNDLLHRSWGGRYWASWKSLGGQIESPPEAVCWGTNRIDVFARGSDKKHICHRWWDGRSWANWQQLEDA